MLAMLPRQPVVGQGLVDVLLHPAGELLVARAPLLQPGGEIGARFTQLASVVDPAQLLQAVVVGLARKMFDAVAKKMPGPNAIDQLSSMLSWPCAWPPVARPRRLAR